MSRTGRRPNVTAAIVGTGVALFAFLALAGDSGAATLAHGGDSPWGQTTTHYTAAEDEANWLRVRERPGDGRTEFTERGGLILPDLTPSGLNPGYGQLPSPSLRGLSCSYESLNVASCATVEPWLVQISLGPLDDFVRIAGVFPERPTGGAPSGRHISIDCGPGADRLVIDSDTAVVGSVACETVEGP